MLPSIILTSIQYIVNLVGSRAGVPPLTDLNTIDDPRNGLLLCVGLHISIGLCKSAFLKVCCIFPS
jgi:HNH endonuclease